MSRCNIVTANCPECEDEIKHCGPARCGGHCSCAPAQLMCLEAGVITCHYWNSRITQIIATNKRINCYYFNLFNREVED